MTSRAWSIATDGPIPMNSTRRDALKDMQHRHITDADGTWYGFSYVAADGSTKEERAHQLTRSSAFQSAIDARTSEIAAQETAYDADKAEKATIVTKAQSNTASILDLQREVVLRHKRY